MTPGIPNGIRVLPWATPCRHHGCLNDSAFKTVWCEEHRYPARREDGICLHTFCNRNAEGEAPWCWEHTQDNNQREERDYLKDAAKRAVYLAEHLHGMIDRETWRAQGADDQQGHYEGDYWAEQTHVEIAELKAALNV